MTATKPADPSSLLRHALRANALFSTLCGLVFIAAPAPVAAWTGLPQAKTVMATGLMLLAFAAGLLLNSRRPQVNEGQAWLAVGLDAGWVALTFWLLARGWFTPGGKIFVAIIAVAVGAFALLQFAGLRRVRAARIRAG